VFITDDTFATEITSYKQAVSIEPATITAKMRADHDESVRIIEDDLHLITSHSIIIVDQSGSMRAADVNGFRSRSHAAYGALALDYVAEQLYHRGDDTLVDAVTIIEMNDVGSFFVYREPLDWLLFNKILDRQRTAKPRSHGHYLNSLVLAEKVVKADMETFSDLDKEDIPAYAIVFLSDGKPSDKTDADEWGRLEVVGRLSSQLGDKLTVYGMGIGARGAEFDHLQTLTGAADDFGSQGQFTHAGLSSASLSTAFSSIATSVTTTRTELLTAKDGGKEKTKKQYTLVRKRSDAKARGTQSRFAEKGVSRWKYDPSKTDYPWTEKGFLNQNTVGFEVELDPFGVGAERLAFRFHEVRMEDNVYKRVGKMMVAKESKFIEDEQKKESFHYHFCRVQLRANELAKDFNKAVKICPALNPAPDEVSVPPRIVFLPCSIYEYPGDDGYNCGLLVESFLEGKFTKYTGNNGYITKQQESQTIDLDVGEVRLIDFVFAFSHWAYVNSDQKLLICDLQGILNREGRHPKFQLTDPAICSKGGRRRNRYGKTDLGMKGILNFIRTHKCNRVCKGLGLHSIKARSHKNRGRIGN